MLFNRKELSIYMLWLRFLEQPNVWVPPPRHTHQTLTFPFSVSSTGNRMEEKRRKEMNPSAGILWLSCFVTFNPRNNLKYYSTQLHVRKLKARRLVNCIMQWQNTCLPEITLKPDHRLVKLVGLERSVENH